MHPFASILAYLDPGSGSYLIQILIAALLGGGFVIKAFWKQIMVFFSRLFGKKQQTTDVKEEITDEQSK